MSVLVASVQMECVPFAVGENLARADELIEQAASAGAQLIVLPEMFNTGLTYDARLLSFSEPIGGPTTRWMEHWSRRTGCLVGGALAEKAEDGTYDTFVLATPSGKVHWYRKRYPAFFEKLYFRKGRGEGVFVTPLGRIGVMICWDMVHQRLARELAGRIDVLLISAAWPDMTTGNVPLGAVQRWMARQPCRRPSRLAVQLAVPVVYANATGRFETRVPGLGLRYRCEFIGRSSVIGPSGTPQRVLGREAAVIVERIGASGDRWIRVHPSAGAFDEGRHQSIRSTKHV